MTQDQTFISATLSLANGALRATLLLEVSLAHPSFCRESPLSDLRKNAEENFPIVLAQVAPQPLRQILEKAEGLLLSRATEDLTSGEPLFKKMYPEQFAEKKAQYVFSSGRSDFMTDDDRKRFWAEACKEIAKCNPEKSFINEAQASVGTASDAVPAKESFDEILRQWASRQEGGFSMLDALTKGLGLSEEQATPAICTRVGIALKKLGCKYSKKLFDDGWKAIYHAPSADKDTAKDRSSEARAPYSTTFPEKRHVPRESIFIGTTNEAEMLNATGSSVSPQQSDKNQWNEWLNVQRTKVSSFDWPSLVDLADRSPASPRQSVLQSLLRPIRSLFRATRLSPRASAQDIRRS